MRPVDLAAMLRRGRQMGIEPAGRGLLALLAVAGLATGPMAVARSASSSGASSMAASEVQAGIPATPATSPAAPTRASEQVAASAAGGMERVAEPSRSRSGGLRVAELDAAVSRALGDGRDTVGVAVVDRRTGTRYARNGDLPVEMASTTKVLIAVAFLTQRRADGRELDAVDRHRLEAMIRFSDNDSASSLRDEAGGAQGIARTALRLGMPRTAEHAGVMPSWGSVRTTAAEQATLMAHLAAGGDGLVHPDDCAFVLSEMRQVTPSQRWGAGAVGSPTVDVALKNGWLPSRHVGWVVNTIGLVRGDGRDYVVAVYEHGAGGEGRGIERKNAVVRAVHEALARPLVP